MKGARVLIVEDELIVQLHLRRIVEGLGLQVVGTAAGRQEALALAERERPDLVMMDIHLDGGDDGIETARTLAERFDCEVVFISAYADPATVARSASVGASGYLVKPFSGAQVQAALSTALAGSHRLRRAEQRSRSLTSLIQDLAGALLMVDHRGLVTFSNKTACEWLEWPAHELENTPLLEAFEASPDKTRQALTRAFGEALEGQRGSLSGLEIRGRAGAVRTLDLEFEPVRENELDQGAVVRLRERDPIRAARPAQPAPERPFQPGTRMLVYSHDTFGLGHLRRCMALIRTLVRDHEGLSVLLVTGSPMVHRYTMPAGSDYVKLPSLRKVESERYEARSLGIPGKHVQSLRASLILDTVREYDPHVLLVDHAPTGSKGELLPTLEWLEQRGNCVRILGMRDILDDPEAVRELWQKTGMHDVLERHYDHVVVYGAREIYDPLEAYGFPPALAARARFVNYVCNQAEKDSGGQPASSDRPTVVVTIGGGDGGGDTLIAPFLEMMRLHRDRIDFQAEILTGPFVDADLERRLRELAAGLPVTLHPFVPSTADFLRRAELVIATAGYNTVTDILVHARRALLVPRVLYRREQELRAQRLSQLGLVTMLHPRDVTPDALLEAIQKARSDEPLVRARARGLPLDGAERFSAFCRELAQAPKPEPSHR